MFYVCLLSAFDKDYGSIPTYQEVAVAGVKSLSTCSVPLGSRTALVNSSFSSAFWLVCLSNAMLESPFRQAGLTRIISLTYIYPVLHFPGFFFPILESGYVATLWTPLDLKALPKFHLLVLNAPACWQPLGSLGVTGRAAFIQLWMPNLFYKFRERAITYIA